MKKYFFTPIYSLMLLSIVYGQTEDTMRREPANNCAFALPKYTGPYYPDCGEAKDRLACSAEKIVEYMSENLTYPTYAIENKVQGKVLAKFTIEKDGSLTKTELVLDIGAGCGEEVLRVLRLMPRWEYGSARGRPVKIPFILTVKFIMEGRSLGFGVETKME